MSAALRVLVVEDSPVDAKLIVAALRHAGHQVEVERVDSAEAMRASLAKPWDVITCDWAMPGFSAPAALALVKESGLDIPFIIVSGTVGEELAVDAMRAGAHDYVIKDRLARLAPAVERELRAARERAQQRLVTAELVTTERRYRRIVETTNQGVWEIDLAGRTTFLNERMAELLGSSVADVLGRSPMEFLEEEGRSRFAGTIETHRRTGVPIQTEARFIRPDGTAVWGLVESSAIVDPSGEMVAAFAMVMDITARKQTEAQLRISEDRFRSLWESGIILITISDLHGKIVDVNEGFARALGYTREELLSGRVRWSDLTPEKWTEADRIAVGQLAKEGVAAPWEKELIAKDGSRVPILAGAVMLEGSEGITIAIDLTERKRVDKALFERMKTAALAAEIGIALTHQTTLPAMLQKSSEAIVQHLDAALARIWTLDAGSSVLELQASAGIQHPGDHARVAVGKLEIGKIAQDREPHLSNDVLHDPRIDDPAWAAREGLVAFAGYPLIVGADLVGVVAVYSRDILADAVLEGLRSMADAIAVGIQRNRAELAKESLEAQLRQAQKLEAIGSLAGGIAHDFNNILSVILSYSEFIRSDLEPGHPLIADVDEINGAAIRAAGLTRQLLAFSRQQVLQPRVLNLNEVIADLKSMLRRLLSEDIDLVITADPGIGNNHADPGQIEQVLMNLVVNARDAMRSGGTLTIETANVDLDAAFAADHVGVTPGRHTMLGVTDTGEGMTEAIRARIFEPFFTTKEKGKGTGLGLSTVFGIVRQSGGTIWVDSKFGIGTSFKAYLPVVAADVGAAQVSRHAAIPRGTETVLLCEDEAPVRAIARAILTRNGYRVLEAQNGGEALLLCEQHGAIDLLLTDVVMPMMSGRQLAERLQTIRPTLKVIYMSGYTDDAIVRHGVLKDEIDFVQKPFTPEVLMRKVREVLDAAMRVR